MYREVYDMFTNTEIWFNHESPIRDLKFVTRKIANGITEIKLGLERYGRKSKS